MPGAGRRGRGWIGPPLAAGGFAGLAVYTLLYHNPHPLLGLLYCGNPACLALAAMSYYMAAAGLMALGGAAAGLGSYAAAVPAVLFLPCTLFPREAGCSSPTPSLGVLLLVDETALAALGLGLAAAGARLGGLAVAAASAARILQLTGRLSAKLPAVSLAGYTLAPETFAYALAAASAALLHPGVPAAASQPRPSQPPPPPPPQPRPSQPPAASAGVESCSVYGYRLAELAAGGQSAKNVIEKCVVGRIIYGYKVEKLLGLGGFGAVLLGVRQLAGSLEKAALKLILPPGPDSGQGNVTTRSIYSYIKTLNREAANIIELSEKSPYIVRLKGIHVEPDTVFNAIKYQDIDAYLAAPPVIIMEYLAGGTLQDYMKAMRLRGAAERNNEQWLRFTAAVAAAVAKALKAIHREGFIHSDLKPENILFTSHPGYDLKHALREALKALHSPEAAKMVPKVSDLGSATRIGAEIESATILYADYPVKEYFLQLTSGTPTTPPPKAHPAMDIYSLAAILVETIHAHLGDETRKKLLKDDLIAATPGPNGTIKMRLRRDKLRKLLSGLEPLDKLIERMMDEDPSKRPSLDRIEDCLTCLAETPKKNWSTACTRRCPV